MAENRAEVLAGAAVLAAAIGFLIYAGRETGVSGPAGSYELTAAYTNADGQLIYKTIDIKAPAKDLTVTF